MSKTLKVYHVAGATEYSNWIPNSKTTDNLEEADLVLFEGGEDVSPMIYGEPVGRATGYNASRDAREVRVFNKARELNKPLLGICRGSQLMCALAGGKLVQDQERQPYVHPIFINGGKDTIKITSTHHQAQYPYNLDTKDYTVLGFTKNLSSYHLDGYNKEIQLLPAEVEICYYRKTNALAIQGHPEFIWKERNNYKDTFEYLHSLISKLLNKEL